MSVAGETVGAAALRGWKQRVREGAHAAVRPLVRLLMWMRIGPDALTVLGLAFSLMAGFMFLGGFFRQGAVWALVAGACDLLDGELARASGRGSRFGAFLDSTLDRVSEAAVLGGLAAYYVTHLVSLAEDPMLRLEEADRGLLPLTWALAGLTAVAALVGSFLVSYTRARAEGLGLECKVGWFERPERLVLVVVAAAFGVGPVMMAALLLLTLLSWWTAVQRLLHVWRATRAVGG